MFTKRSTMKTEAGQKIYNKGRSNDFIIRVNNDSSMACSGKIEHVQSGQTQYFNDFLQMVMLVQDKLDDRGHPQCDTELRTFGDKQ